MLLHPTKKKNPEQTEKATMILVSIREEDTGQTMAPKIKERDKRIKLEGSRCLTLKVAMKPQSSRQYYVVLA